MLKFALREKKWMMSKILVLACGVALIYVGVKGIQSRFSIIEEAPVKNYQELLQRDRRNIKGKLATSNDYFESVRRLAQEQDLEALNKIEIYLQSEKKEYLYLGVQAVGFYEDPKIYQRLFKIIDEASDEDLVILSLQSLSKRKNIDREKFIEAWLAKADHAKLSYVVALESLVKVTENPEKRQEVKSQLLNLFQNKNNINRTVILTILCQHFKNEKEINELVRKIVKQVGDMEEVRIAILALAHSEDAWFAKNLHSLIKNQSVDYVKTVIEILHVLCPPGRKQILQEVLTGPWRRSLLFEVLDEVELLNEPDLIELLNQERQKKDWLPDHLVEIDKTLAALKHSIGTQRPGCYVKDNVFLNKQTNK